ncbi:hypothetical protein [Kribbella deserti]|uniref:Uncharacterized protein n=1 Tax=Kribbella deserti TaxID=1926257 RepID=A0ABV6QK02_9ACTN
MRRSQTARHWLTALVASLGLVLLPGSAWAADDPPVPQWPSVQPPNSSSTSSDPPAQAWPSVEPPASSNASDPQPPAWPVPEQP